MYFDGFDFEQRAYKIMNISYIANRVVYVDSDMKRTSYYLTDDGYNLLLSTLEIENNMKLAVDIAMVKKEKDKIEGLLEDYVKEVHSNMGKIDNNSTITVRERPIKMLRLQIPDWEENEGVYHQRFEDFMDELTRNGIEIYEQNENVADYLSSRITTKNLYDTIVGIENIQIKLYKIEEQREYPITWAEVARNSGGEGFFVGVCYFIQFTALYEKG